MKTEYRFEAIKHFRGGRIIDHWEIEADSFQQACEIAQEREIYGAEAEEREATIYNMYKRKNND